MDIVAKGDRAVDGDYVLLSCNDGERIMRVRDVDECQIRLDREAMSVEGNWRKVLMKCAAWENGCGGGDESQNHSPKAHQNLVGSIPRLCMAFTRWAVILKKSRGRGTALPTYNWCA